MKYLVFIIVVIWVVYSISQKTKKKSVKKRGTNSPKKDILAEAQAIADKIITLQSYCALEKRLEKAEYRVILAESDSAIKNAEHKVDVLNTARDLAQPNIRQWQFIPRADLHTPKQILEHVYKLFSRKEFEEFKKTLPIGAKNYKYDLSRIDEIEDMEEPEPYIKSLIKFRNIVEADLPKTETVKKINQLAQRDKDLSDNFFDLRGPLTPGDQWFAEKMGKDGLPCALELYSAGYTTPEKCLEIDHKEFAARKGVGPKRLAQLKEYQIKVRDGSSPMAVSI